MERKFFARKTRSGSADADTASGGDRVRHRWRVVVCAVAAAIALMGFALPAAAAAVAVFGDSLAVGTADALVSLALPGTKVLRLAKNGYGLSQKDAWARVAVAAAQAGAARVSDVFVLVGTNDGRGLPDKEGHIAQFGTEEWATLYTARLGATAAAFRAVGADVQLIAIPAPHASSHAAIAARVFAIERAAASRWGMPVVAIGRVAPAGSMRSDGAAGLRAADGIHLTATGYKEIALSVARAANIASQRRLGRPPLAEMGTVGAPPPPSSSALEATTSPREGVSPVADPPPSAPSAAPPLSLSSSLGRMSPIPWTSTTAAPAWTPVPLSSAAANR